MSTITTKDADDSKHQCAACGVSDDGGGSLKACTACNLVKYCKGPCQVVHWSAHEQACKKRVAELFDEELFKQPPPNEDCLICYIRLPIDGVESFYQPCRVLVVYMQTQLLQQIQKNSSVSSVELKQLYQRRRILKE
jgi:hypothetical protein